jgi:O-antigen ligase
LAALAILLAFGYMARVPKIVLQVPRSIILPIGLIIIIGLQTLSGNVLFPIDSFFPILYLLLFALSMIVGATMVAQNRGIDHLCEALAFVYLAVGLVSVLFQDIQLFNLDCGPLVMPIVDRDRLRPYANIAQPNMMALILCFALASIWWLFKIRRLNAWISSACVLIIFWGLVLTQSRIAWMILPLFALFCGQRTENYANVPKKAVFLMLVIFAMMVFCSPDILSWIGQPIESISKHAGETSVRIVLWKQAWLMSTIHPWVGTGWFQFGHYQAIFASLFPPTEYSEYAHNIILNFAAELGWVVTIIIVVGSVYWFYKYCVKRWTNLHVRFLSLIIIAAILHSMVEYPLWYGIVLFPFGVIVGALDPSRLSAKVLEVSRFWIIGLCSLAFVSMIAITTDYYRVMLGFNALVWQQAGEKNGIGSTDRPQFTVFPQYYDYFRLAKITVSPGMDVKEIDFLERSAMRFAYPPILMRLAMAYAYNKRQDEALQVLVTIQRLHKDEYESSYESWEKFAQHDPNIFAVIFAHMPKPAIEE